MPNTLAEPVDLEPYPGAPFDEDIVDAAAATVRGEAGWHIAPLVTETLTVLSWGGQFLPIPSGRIVSVSAVRDVSGPTTLTDYMLLPGTIFRQAGWPAGAIEVDLTHGYEETPDDLFPVLAARARAVVDNPNVRQRSSQIDDYSEAVTYRDTTPSDPVVSRYAVPGGVA